MQSVEILIIILVSEKPQERNARNEFKYPLNCQNKDCTYEVKWTKIDNEIEVTVSAMAMDESDWIGVGFSKNNVMPETDIVVGFFDENGNAIVKDYYSFFYSPPTEDKSQDIKDTSLSRKDGLTTMKFKRSINSSDEVHFQMKRILGTVLYLQYWPN